MKHARRRVKLSRKAYRRPRRSLSLRRRRVARRSFPKSRRGSRSSGWLPLRTSNFPVGRVGFSPSRFLRVPNSYNGGGVSNHNPLYNPAPLAARGGNFFPLQSLNRRQTVNPYYGKRSPAFTSVASCSFNTGCRLRKKFRNGRVE